MTPSASEVFDILIRAAGVAGLLLAGYSLYLQRRDKQPKLRITDVIIGIMEVKPTSDGAGGTLLIDAPGVSLRLQNIGEKEIRLRSFLLCTTSLIAKQNCTQLNLSNLYITLGTVSPGSGRALEFYIPDITPLQTKRMYIQVEDEIGNLYRSKRFFVQLDKLKAPTV